MKYTCYKNVFCLLAGGIGSLAGGMASAKSADNRPNILIIMADQWQGKALGCLGTVPVKTPNLDKLAADGVLFTNAMSNYPVSSPARGMFMTGMYPMSNHVTSNCYMASARYGVELSEDAVCWSDCLKEAGYAMGYIGKWHLDAPHEPLLSANGEWNEWCPPERRHGFDYWEAYGTYDRHLRPLYWSTDADREHFHFVDEWGPIYEAGKAIEFIGKHHEADDGRPFCLMVSMNPPHTVYTEVPQKYLDIYKDMDVESICSDPRVKDPESREGKLFRRDIRYYYACMTGVDEQIGRIIGFLKKEGLYDDTLIIFVSDHGDFVGTMGDEHKNMPYEDAMRIPLIMTWEGKLQPRVDDRTLFGIADFCPTLLSMTGLGEMIPASVESYDHGKYIMEGRVSRAASFQPYYRFPLDPKSPAGLRGIRDGRYVYVADIRDSRIVVELLFDRIEDPYQMSNIAEDRPGLVRKYRKLLKRHLEKTSDPLSDCL